MVRRIRNTVVMVILCSLCGVNPGAYAQRGEATPSPAAPQDSAAFVIAVAGGMGITAISATDLVDYINAATVYSQRLDDFSSAAEFFANVQVRWSDSWGGKIDYGYLINSYTITNSNGTFEYSYVIHMPTVGIQYLDVHPGYAFKFGGGIGYHIASLSERVQGSSRNLVSKGLGVKVDAEANTLLDVRLYVYIGGEMRLNIMSAFRDSNGNLLPVRTGSGTSSAKNASMNFFALGLKFGLIYYF
jgi:hypothetical protein